MSKNWLWIILIIFVFIIATEFVVFMLRGKPYQMESYEMKLQFAENGNATITTHTIWRFKKETDAMKYSEAFTKSSTQVTQKMEEDLQKILNRKIKILAISRKAELLSSNVVDIRESLTLGNAADVSNGKIKVVFGEGKMRFPVDSSIIYEFPEGYEVTLAVPTPTTSSGRVLKWEMKQGQEAGLPVAVAEKEGE